MEPITLSWYLSHESSPLAYRFMIAAPPQLRKRRITALLANACEVAIRLQQLGGEIKINGVLNPAEFADPLEDPFEWKGFAVRVQVYPFVTPFLYDAVKGRDEKEVRSIVSTALETYLLLVGATTLPSQPAQQTSVINMGGQRSTVPSNEFPSSSAKMAASNSQTEANIPSDKLFDSEAASASKESSLIDPTPTHSESSAEGDAPEEEDDLMSHINSLGKAT